MPVDRVEGVFLGTDETTGVTIANNATSSGSQVDVLGDDAAGELEVYLRFTSTVTVGTLDVTLHKHRVTGGAYVRRSAHFGVTPINGSDKVPLGRIPASRYMSGSVFNNATGASATNVTLGYEAFIYS